MRLHPLLQPFARRVRVVRAWRGIGMGLALGGVVAATLGLLDLIGRLDATWLLLLTIVGASAFLGGVIGFLQPFRETELADSIDRRADLANRIGTAVVPLESPLIEAQHEDAWSHLRGVSPREVYPLRLSRQHLLGVGLTALACGLLFTSRSQLLMSSEEKAARADLAKAAPAIERVAKIPEERSTDQKLSPAEKQLVQEMRELAKKLQQERLSKDSSLQKANDLIKKAEELEKNRQETMTQKLASAGEMMEDKALDQAAKELGMSPEQMKQTDQSLARQQMQMATQNPGKMGEMQRMNDARMNELQKQMDALKKQLQSGKNEKGEPLSAEERKALEQKMKELAGEMAKLKLSQKALDMLKKLTSMPEFKELQKMMQQMSQGQQGGQGQKPTKEQIEEMQKMLEELAEKLKDEKAMREFLQQMKEALEQMQMGAQLSEMQMGMLGALGMMPMNGPSGPGQDNFFRDLHNLPKRDTPTDIQSKANPLATSGERQDKGEETYVEIKGPTKVGNRSSTPYINVLPEYRHRAEEALNRKQIPKKHEKRVKQYFDSLQK